MDSGSILITHAVPVRLPIIPIDKFHTRLDTAVLMEVYPAITRRLATELKIIACGGKLKAGGGSGIDRNAIPVRQVVLVDVATEYATNVIRLLQKVVERRMVFYALFVEPAAIH